MYECKLSLSTTSVDFDREKKKNREKKNKKTTKKGKRKKRKEKRKKRRRKGKKKKKRRKEEKKGKKKEKKREEIKKEKQNQISLSSILLYPRHPVAKRIDSADVAASVDPDKWMPAEARAIVSKVLQIPIVRNISSTLQTC